VSTCCDNITLELRKEYKGSALPSNLKAGDWLYVAGIIWVKKINGLWKCLSFDSKTRLCKIYKYRPPLCRSFQCKYAIKKKVGKLPVNYRSGDADSVYKIIAKNPSVLQKKQDATND